jgi:hypothetical protein
MPQLQVKTLSAEEAWKSPDGKITIFKLTLEHNGQEVGAKTYSKAIATTGWQGTVETYEKSGRNGAETFVKQPQREGFAPGGASTRNYGGAKPVADNFTMFLSYAKDLAIACIKDGKFDDKLYAELLDTVEVGGKVLFNARPDAPKDTEGSKEELDAVFGKTEEITEEDEPWQEPPQLPV